MTKIYEQATQYMISAVPLEWPAARLFSVKVRSQRPGEWTVEHLGEYLTLSGDWTFALAERGTFELEEALSAARKAVPNLTSSRYTVADALRNGPDWH